MEYLTTHDLVWINNIVTGRVLPYDYVTLEAAMAGQYSYGESRSTLDQAGKLLDRILRNAPFAHGNRRTALIATLTFLNANGYATKSTDRDAADVIFALEQGATTAPLAMEALAAPAVSNLPEGLTLRKLMIHECNLHAEALTALAPGD